MMVMLIPSFLVVLITTLLTSVHCFSCPDYESIATPSVAADKFSLMDFTGEWYMMATSEPTMPSFITCPRLKWFVDNEGAIKQYHYSLTANCNLTADCKGINFTATMKGEARDPRHPGSLVENMEFHNHSVAPYVPNMIFDVEVLPDGNVVGFTYACLLGKSPVNMYSFNVVARKPTLTPDAVKALVAKQNERVGGVFKVDGIRYSDSSACGWDVAMIV